MIIFGFHGLCFPHSISQSLYLASPDVATVFILEQNPSKSRISKKPAKFFIEDWLLSYWGKRQLQVSCLFLIEGKFYAQLLLFFFWTHYVKATFSYVLQTGNNLKIALNRASWRWLAAIFNFSFWKFHTFKKKTPGFWRFFRVRKPKCKIYL